VSGRHSEQSRGGAPSPQNFPLVQEARTTGDQRSVLPRGAGRGGAEERAAQYSLGRVPDAVGNGARPRGGAEGGAEER
jgi:hypothetical protein